MRVLSLICSLKLLIIRELYDKLSAVYISDIAAWCNIRFYDSYSQPLCYAGNLYLNGELVTDLVIPYEVTNIKEYAFINCGSITSVMLPNGTTSVNSTVFRGCTNLTSITIPKSVTRIDSDAFSGVSENMTVYGYTDSYAEFFATTNGYKFVSISCTYDESSYTHFDEVPATCTTDGYAAGTYCNECERWIEGHEVLKHITLRRLSLQSLTPALRTATRKA